jgi:inosine-uridine nucleoside N-ribohydrolase
MRNMILTLLFPLFACATTPCIIDTDGEVSDLISILFLLKSEKMQVKAITTTSSEKDYWNPSIDRILNSLQLSGHPNIPVSYGSVESLSPRITLDQNWTSEREVNCSLPENPNSPSHLRSPDLLIETIKNSQEKVSIVALAPLTNIALALRRNRSIKQNIERIYIMSGAIDVPGNALRESRGAARRYAEYNLVKDALAAYEVLFSGIPITIIPYDATHKVCVLNEIYINLVHLRKNSPIADFLFTLIQPLLLSRFNSEDYFWNLIASSVIIDRKVGHFQCAKVLINLEEGEEYGRLLLHRRGAPIEVCTNIDTRRFYHLFNQTLK